MQRAKCLAQLFPVSCVSITYLAKFQPFISTLNFPNQQAGYNEVKTRKKISDSWLVWGILKGPHIFRVARCDEWRLFQRTQMWVSYQPSPSLQIKLTNSQKQEFAKTFNVSLCIQPQFCHLSSTKRNRQWDQLSIVFFSLRRRSWPSFFFQYSSLIMSYSFDSIPPLLRTEYLYRWGGLDSASKRIESENRSRIANEMMDTFLSRNQTRFMH